MATKLTALRRFSYQGARIEAGAEFDARSGDVQRLTGGAHPRASGAPHKEVASAIAGVDFASDEAAEAAADAGLVAADLLAVKPSGAHGYTKGDVLAAAKAKEAE